MDCKKKYDEALERAIVAYKDEDKHLKATLERIFPELKESEDEKIRKRIIHALHGDVLDMEETNIAIAWLEKQGKPSDEEMKTLLRTEYEKGRADAIAEMQKEWSEEDEKILRTILSDGIRGAELDMLQVNWLKSLRPQNRWKPSDKHIRFLQAIVNDPNNASSESCQIVLKDILEKLKKLKEG